MTNENIKKELKRILQLHKDKGELDLVDCFLEGENDQSHSFSEDLFHYLLKHEAIDPKVINPDKHEINELVDVYTTDITKLIREYRRHTEKSEVAVKDVNAYLCSLFIIQAGQTLEAKIGFNPYSGQ